MKKIYLDNNATTPMRKEVVDKMFSFAANTFGNPSSMHEFGRITKKEIEEARNIISKVINSEKEEIVFTSGGTESNNLAIKGIVNANKKYGRHIVTTSIEHPSVLNTFKYLEKEGYEVTFLPVDKYGVVDVKILENSLRDDTIFLSIMYANNEIGILQPIKDITKLLKEINENRKKNNLHKIYLHTDAVQALGKLKIDVKNLDIDLLSISAHKINGPKGVGALFIRKGVNIKQIMHGGHQEHLKRPGTENTTGIIGFGEACKILTDKYVEEEAKKLFRLKKRLYDGIMNNIDETYLNGRLDNSLSGTLNLSFNYIEGESVVMKLDFLGIAVSSGSACMSDTLEASYVLTSMGIDRVLCQSAIRFGLGVFTTEEDVDYVIKVLPDIIKNLREMSPLYKKDLG